MTKSLPKKTPVTPSIWKSFFANGERIDSRALEKFIDDDEVDDASPSPPRTGFPGRNISEDGFGVDWVWMNIALLCVVFARDEETPKRNESNGSLLREDEEELSVVDKARALLRCAFLPPLPPSEEKKSAEEEEEEEEDADSEDNRLKTEEEELHSLGANSLFFFPRRRSALAARREMNDDIMCACFFPHARAKQMRKIGK